MLKLFFIFIGGGIGSVLRFLTSLICKGILVGTFAVNIIGSFILGVLSFYLLEKFQISNELKLMLTAGFCGGFTTFSTFSLECFNMIQNGLILKCLIYMISSIVFSLFAIFLGVYFAKQF